MFPNTLATVAYIHTMQQTAECNINITLQRKNPPTKVQFVTKPISDAHNFIILEPWLKCMHDQEIRLRIIFRGIPLFFWNAELKMLGVGLVMWTQQLPENHKTDSASVIPVMFDKVTVPPEVGAILVIGGLLV